MTEFTRLRAALSGSVSPPHPYSAQEWDATSRIANSMAIRMIGRQLLPHELKTGAAFVHYTTAAVAGGLYGAIAQRSGGKSRWPGALFGAGLWLLGNELLLPALGIIKRDDYTLGMRANALEEHIVFGMTTDRVCRQPR